MPIIAGTRTAKGVVYWALSNKAVMYDGKRFGFGELGVRPRPAFARTKDLSTPISGKKLAGFKREIESLKSLYSSSGEGPDYIARNDALMGRIRREAGRQGIVCSLAKSSNGQSLMLVIEGSVRTGTGSRRRT